MRKHKIATAGIALTLLIGLGALTSHVNAQGQGQDNSPFGQILTAIKNLNTDVAFKFTGLASQVTSGFSSLNSQMASGFSQVSGQLNTISGQVSGSRAPSNSRTILLVPFVSDSSGFSTHVAISNTTLDQLGTAPHAGTVQICYFTGRVPPGPPPCQTTSSAVPAGAVVEFTLAGGGSFGIGAEPGFEGYLVIKCEFPGAHGFAYLSGKGTATSDFTGMSIPVHVVPEPRNLSFVEQLGQ